MKASFELTVYIRMYNTIVICVTEPFLERLSIVNFLKRTRMNKVLTFQRHIRIHNIKNVNVVKRISLWNILHKVTLLNVNVVVRNSRDKQFEEASCGLV